MKSDRIKIYEAADLAAARGLKIFEIICPREEVNTVRHRLNQKGLSVAIQNRGAKGDVVIDVIRK